MPRVASRPSPLRDAVIEEFDAMLELDFDPGDVLLALGRGYDATWKLLYNSNRPDLLSRLVEWKKADAERLKRARGLYWQ